MKTLKKFWWLIALRGVFAIVIGLLALIWPGLTFEVFLIILGLYILVEGIIATLTGLTSIGKKNRHWLLALVEGLVGIIVGWVLFTSPMDIIFTLPLFVQVFAIWIILVGFLRIVMAIMVRAEVKNEFFMALNGLLSVMGIIVP